MGCCLLFALVFGRGREDDRLIRQDPGFADLFSPHDAAFITEGAQVPTGAFQCGGRLGNTFHDFIIIPKVIECCEYSDSHHGFANESNESNGTWLHSLMPRLILSGTIGGKPP